VFTRIGVQILIRRSKVVAFGVSAASNRACLASRQRVYQTYVVAIVRLNQRVVARQRVIERVVARQRVIERVVARQRVIERVGRCEMTDRRDRPGNGFQIHRVVRE